MKAFQPELINELTVFVINTSSEHSEADFWKHFKIYKEYFPFLWITMKNLQNVVYHKMLSRWNVSKIEKLWNLQKFLGRTDNKNLLLFWYR